MNSILVRFNEWAGKRKAELESHGEGFSSFSVFRHGESCGINEAQDKLAEIIKEEDTLAFAEAAMAVEQGKG